MCGIVGIAAQEPVNQLLYDALLLLQHRGQDAAGIVTQQGSRFNMHKAKANWLYTLKEWEPILSEEKRKDIAKEYRQSTIFVREAKVGRNDPCPCGSGKKYKACCGKNA